MKIASPIFLLIILLCGFLPAQDSPVISNLEDLLVTIRFNRGDLLYPQEFYRNKEKFEELKQKSRIRALTDSELEQAQAIEGDFQEISNLAVAARPFFSIIFAARDEAVSAGAKDFAPQIFERAENGLKELAEDFRKNRLSVDENKVNDVQRLYLQAQFEAIRNKLLSEVRILIQESKDMGAEKYAPRTYLTVTELLADVERILNRNQLDDPRLQEKAALLAAESQHLLYLTRKAREVQQEDAAFEKIMMDLESSITDLAGLLNYQPDFADGVKPVLENIELSVSGLQEENAMLKERNRALLDSVAGLRQQINELHFQLGEEQKTVENIASLKAQFAGTPVKVLRRDNKIILRLNGVTFQPGKYLINEKYHDILEKIGMALQAFPGTQFLVRLGQSFSGNMDYNQALADQRAKNVAFLIQSAGFIEDQRIRSEGVMMNDLEANGHAVVEVVLDLSSS